MSILIINASPRKSGNSTFITESLKEKYGDSCQVVNLAELNIKPCTSCRYCKINNSFCFTALIARILHKKQLLGNYPFSCL